MATDLDIHETEGGYELRNGGAVVVHLDGKDGDLTVRYPSGPAPMGAAQECFDKCFANSNGTAGAAKKCAEKCGLE